MRARAEALTALQYVALFLPAGAHLPLWPLWLSAEGLGAAEIGLIAAATGTLRIAAGFLVPAVVERAGAERAALVLLPALAGAVYLLFGAAEGFGALLLLSLAATLAWSGLFPLAEALGSGAAEAGGFPYARPRAAGSLAFLLANLLCGAALARFGPEAVRWWIAASLLAAAPLAFLHPGLRARRGMVRAPFSEVRAFLLDPALLVFAGAVAAIQGAHAMLYTFGSLHWAALGLTGAEIGALWAAAVAAETALMLVWGRRLAARVGPVAALAVSAGAGVLRWGLMVLDPSGPLLWLLQASHALTFALGHLATIAFLARALPERLSATAQGFVVSLAGGTAMAGAAALCGLLYPALGGLTWAVAAALSAAGLGLALLLGRVWDGRRLGPAGRGVA